MHQSVVETDQSMAKILRSPQFFWMAGLSAILVLGHLLPAGKYFADAESYLPFHTFLELISTTISAMVFALAWNLRAHPDNARFTLMGTGFLAVCLIDTAHILSYNGMPPFITESHPEKAIYFWLMARFVAAATLLAAALVPDRTWSNRTHIALLLTAIALVAAVGWGGLWHLDWFPRTFIAGQGLTAFKIGAEYLLFTVCAITTYLLIFRRNLREADESLWLAAAAWTQGLAEMFFTLYADVTDTHNLLGHVFKALAYLMTYRAIYVSGIMAPYRILDRERSELRTILDGVDAFIYLKDIEGRYLFANHSVRKLLNAKMSDIIGFSDEKFFDAATTANIRQNDSRVLQGGETLRVEETNTVPSTGKTATYYSVKLPLRKEDGSIYALCGISTDITSRKQSELALESSERQLRFVLEGSELGFWDWNIAAGTVERNARWAEMLGYQHAEIQHTPKQWTDFIHPDDRTRAWESINAVLEGRTNIHRLEYRMLHKDGSTRWILDQAKVMERDPDGNPLRMCGTHTDITVRKQSEAMLIESESRYRHLIESLPDIAYTYSVRHGGIYYSPRAAEVFDCTLNELLSQPQLWADSIHPEDKARVQEAVSEFLAHQAPFKLEYRIRDAKGNWHWFYDRSISVRQLGDDTLIDGLAMDITETKAIRDELDQHRHHLEKLVEERTQALSQSLAQQAFDRERLEYALDATNDGLWDWNTLSNVCYFNRAYKRMLGYEMDELAENANDTWVALLHPEERDSVLEQARHLLETAGAYELEFRMRCKDGSYKWILSRGKVITRDPEGKPLRAIGTHIDLSVRKELELQLRQAKEAAETANQAKSAFLANMSHEIRTPLNAITGMAHILRRSGLTANQTDKLNKIENAGNHLLEIINAILDLSKIEAGKFSLEESLVGVDEVVENVASMVSERAKAKGLTLTLDIAPTPEGLVGDRTRLQQALLNYATNAIKFTDSGRVTLRVAVAENQPDYALIRFEVVDSGTGIPPEAIPRLFTAFEQADNSITRKYGGTGLGLAITRRIAELMGGETGVISDLGKGSTFWLTVRLKKTDTLLGVMNAHRAESPRLL